MGQGPSPAMTRIVADYLNSTINRPATFPDHADFAALGYHGYLIDDWFMIDAVGARDTERMGNNYDFRQKIT